MFRGNEGESDKREGDLGLGRRKKSFLRKQEVKYEEVLKGGEEIEEWFAGIEHENLEDPRRERWARINESNYNRWYKIVQGTGTPVYLKKGWGESRWRRVIRYRLGNKMREGRYWKEKQKRQCRLCETEMEDLKTCVGEMQGVKGGTW